MKEPPFSGQDGSRLGTMPGDGAPHRARSVIPDVPLRREADPDPPPQAQSPLFQALVVYGGLAVIFAVTLLAENLLERRETARLERQVLEMASFSGTPLVSPDARLERVKAEVAGIRNNFGVKVHFLYAPKRYFPKSWLRGPQSPSGVQVPLDELERVLPFVWEFLESYPEHLIRHNLSDIYLAAQLSLYDKKYGGTYGRSSLYASTANEHYRYSTLFFRSVFHHEFSSILMHRYDFPFKIWRAVNEPGFVYPNNALEMLDSDNGNDLSEDLLEGGFLRAYATSDVENDINVMAEWLFAQPAELRRLAARHDRIGKKMRIARDFYDGVDPAISIR